MGSEEGMLEWDLRDELEFVTKRSPAENWRRQGPETRKLVFHKTVSGPAAPQPPRVHTQGPD